MNSKEESSNHHAGVTESRVTAAAAASAGRSEASSQWTTVTFRNLVPRSDVTVVTLPLETAATTSGHALLEENDDNNDTRSNSNNNNNNAKRILHFVIGGETTETSESNIVESIEWTCRRSWRMASLNRPRIGCGAALLRGVIYTVGYALHLFLCVCRHEVGLRLTSVILIIFLGYVSCLCRCRMQWPCQ